MPTLFPSHRLDDPRDLRVVAALEAVGAGRSTVQLPAMSASFRDELRAQLVAVTPRLVEEGVRPGTETAPRRTATSPRRRSATKDVPATRTSARTRPMTVLVAGAAVVVLGLGGATWLARGALPGDALYGLKRTAEGVDVSLSGSQLDKGHAQLVAAQTRVQEVADLVQRPQSMSLGLGTSTAAGALSDSTVKLVVSTLKTADTDTQQGVTTIGDDAIKRDDHAGLDLVVTWAQGQRDRIDALVQRLPSDSAARNQAETSATNIRTGLARAEALQRDYTDKTCQRSRDQFGPTPCTVTTTPTTPARPSSSAPGPGSSGSAPGGSGGSAPASSPATSPTTSAAPTPAASATPSRTTAPSASSSSAPPAVAIDSCGVKVSLPVAGVSLGTCAPTN